MTRKETPYHDRKLLDSKHSTPAYHHEKDPTPISKDQVENLDLYPCHDVTGTPISPTPTPARIESEKADRNVDWILLVGKNKKEGTFKHREEGKWK